MPVNMQWYVKVWGCICMFAASMYLIRLAVRDDSPVVIRWNDPRLATIDTHGKTKVLKHNGVKFERLNDFCTWTPEFDCYKIKTPVGRIPFYVHANGTDLHMSDALRKGWTGEADISPLIEQLRLMDNPMFVDIGANLGLYSMVITNTLKIPALLVEPIIENVVRLCKTIQENNLTDNITVVYNAVSSKHEIVGFQKFKNHYGGSRVQKYADSKTDEAHSCVKPASVMTCTLDDLLPYVTSQNVLLKVDVESHEYHVILGGQKFLDTLNVPIIYMEWWWVRETSGAKHLTELLRTRNYVAYNALSKLKGPHLEWDKYTGWAENIIWVKQK